MATLEPLEPPRTRRIIIIIVIFISIGLDWIFERINPRRIQLSIGRPSGCNGLRTAVPSRGGFSGTGWNVMRK